MAAQRLVAFVPASLTEVMGDLARNYERLHNQKIVLSIAGTSQLARQLDAGAPADIFISADKRWMNWVADRKLIRPSSTVEFAGNRLVVAGRTGAEKHTGIKTLLTEYPFAMGEPDSVPVGQYAREALVFNGWWEKAKERAIYSENTRLALRRLAIGEVNAAIVYSTDVAIEPAVKTLMVFSPESHEPIAYWAALTTATDATGKTDKGGSEADRGTGRVRAAVQFLNYLSSPAAAEILARSGFTPPPDGR